MRTYILSRLAQSAITILGISLIVFALAHLSGDAGALLIPQEATPQQRAELRKSLGLDTPLPQQYGIYLKDTLTGNFGKSFRYGKSALSVFRTRFINTAELALAASAIALLAGVLTGVLGAVRPGSAGDRVTTLFALLGQSVPSFWIAILMIRLFSVRLHWLPTSGKGDLRTFVMPALALAWFSMAALTRMTRSSMLDVLDADYIRLARLKGLPESMVIWKHAFRNALLPVLTLFSLQLILFISGSVVVENVFAWPGVGRLSVEAISSRDYPMVQTIVFLTSSILVLMNLGVDLLYPVIDPRIRLS